MRHHLNFKKMHADVTSDAPEPVHRRDNLPPEMEELPSYIEDIDLRNLEVQIAAVTATIEQQTGKVTEQVANAWTERRGMHFDAVPIRTEADIGRVYSRESFSYAKGDWEMNLTKVRGTCDYIAFQAERIFDEDINPGIRKDMPGLVLDAVYAQRARLINPEDDAFKRCMVTPANGSNQPPRINPVVLRAYFELSLKLRTQQLENGEAHYGDVVIGMLLGRLDADLGKQMSMPVTVTVETEITRYGDAILARVFGNKPTAKNEPS